MSNTSSSIPLTLEFGGGMELLFQNRKSIAIEVPTPNASTIKVRDLLPFIRDEIKPERPELFMQEDTMFANSPRSDGSSTFSSPIPFKRAKLAVDSKRAESTHKSSAVSITSEELEEIYRNSRRCTEIEKNLKQRKWRMASFRATVQVADLIFTRWETASSDALYRQRKQHFANYVVGFVMRVGPSVATLLHALLYCLRLRQIYPQARGEQGCAHRLFVVSLLVATRYLNDRHVLIRPNHASWSTLSGVFTAPELERMEMEFVTFLRGKLFVGLPEMERSVEDFFLGILSDNHTDLECIVPGAVDWLELISVSNAKTPVVTDNNDACVPL